MGVLAAGDAAAVGAGEAVRETPGRGLPASGGRALNANLVLKSKQDQPLVYIVFVY